MLSDLTLNLLILRFLTLLTIAAIQGGVVAGTAVLLGDAGPKYDGRLTANPFRHLDLVGSACLILLGLGWTKPIAIDPQQFRSGRIGLVVVVLAGFAALLLTAAILTALAAPAVMALPYTAGLTTSAFFRVAARLSLWFALFNLLPIPPLTGGQLLLALAPRLTELVKRRQLYLALGLAVLLVTSVARDGLQPAYTAVASLLLND